MCAVDDPEASTQVWKLCKERRIAANIADVPPECDFYFGSVHRDGPLQVMISTNGNGPKLANIVRRQIAARLPPNAGDAVTKVGALRRKLRKVAPRIEEGPKRMQWWVDLLGIRGLQRLISSQDVSRMREVESGRAMRHDRRRYGGAARILQTRYGAQIGSTTAVRRTRSASVRWLFWVVHIVHEAQTRRVQLLDIRIDFFCCEHGIRAHTCSGD